MHRVLLLICAAAALLLSVNGCASAGDPAAAATPPLASRAGARASLARVRLPASGQGPGYSFVSMRVPPGSVYLTPAVPDVPAPGETASAQWNLIGTWDVTGAWRTYAPVWGVSFETFATAAQAHTFAGARRRAEAQNECKAQRAVTLHGLGTSGYAVICVERDDGSYVVHALAVRGTLTVAVQGSHPTRPAEALVVAQANLDLALASLKQAGLA